MINPKNASSNVVVKLASEVYAERKTKKQKTKHNQSFGEDDDDDDDDEDDADSGDL
jgi:hypothetical protein